MKAADARFLAASPYLMEALQEAEERALAAHEAEQAHLTAHYAQMAQVLA